LIGAASLSAALMAGCGDNDAKPTSSAVGESCVRTSDCADGLTCIGNTCYKNKPAASGGEGGEAPAPVPPQLGGEGESCTSRLDCSEGLGCFNQRCTTPPTTPAPGEGGAPGTALELGARGETCRVNGDCAKDLVCIPSTTANGVGVCDLAQYGLTSTGKKCGGECLAATDCCQLPTILQTDPIKSCKDIDDAITTGQIACATPATPQQQKLCFEQATYCSGCSAKTWDCTNNTCVYKLACAALAPNDTPTGCPSYSRINSLAALSCNVDTKQCTGPTPVVCTNDASCTAKPVFDRTAISTDVCSAGECTCYKGNHECYRKCARDIECAVGSTCDTTAHVCMTSPTCTTNEQCAVTHGSLDWQCKKDTGTCAKVCTADRDCSPTGHGTVANFTGSVCAADGFCASLTTDCTDDTQCSSVSLVFGAQPLKTFCVDYTAPVTGGAVSSAISD
jgi:hypothetical protein